MSLLYNPETKQLLDKVTIDMPHALLLEGPVGVGLSTIARDLAWHDLAGLIQGTDNENNVDISSKGVIRISQIRDLIESTRGKLTKRRVYVIDEADKMSDQVLYFFVTLYNELEGHCGVVLCATQYLDKRLVRGLRSGRKGYEEVYSRIGRQCIQLSVLSPEDISLVCVANGITGDRRVRKIADEAECDLRRVRRAVWREHQLAKED